MNRPLLILSLSLLLIVRCNPTFESDEQREARCRESRRDDTPDTEARTIRQRVHLPVESAIELSFDSIEQLQAATDRRHVLQGIALRRRSKVQQEFTVTDFYGKPVKVREGSVVSIRGYIVGIPHVSRADRDPCDTAPGRAARDYVLNLGELAGDTEFDSIIAVITARNRRQHPNDKKWNLEKIRRIARETAMFRLTGQLFYDSKHVVNSDPAAEMKDEPRRLSLWEIHPVTNIKVCRSDTDSGCRDPQAFFDLLEDSP